MELKHLITTIFVLQTIFISNLVSAHGELGSIGFGLGNPYAIEGINVKIKLYEQTYFDLALGDSENQTTYGVGIHQYLLSGEHSWRPGIGLRYGTNGDLYYETSRRVTDNGSFSHHENIEHNRHYSGFDVVLSQHIAFGLNKKHGFDFGLTCRLTDGGWKKDFKKHDGSPSGPDSSCWLPFFGYRINI